MLRTVIKVSLLLPCVPLGVLFMLLGYGMFLSALFDLVARYNQLSGMLGDVLLMAAEFLIMGFAGTVLLVWSIFKGIRVIDASPTS